MKFESIYQLSKDLLDDELLKRIEKRKNSSIVFNYDNKLYLAYDFSYLNLILDCTEHDQQLKSCFESLNQFEKTILLEESSIKELKILFEYSFIRNTPQYIFSCWNDEEIGKNNYFINAYKDLISSKVKSPLSIDSLNAIYEKYVKPRNIAFKKKNIKKFHKFRDTPFSNDLEYSTLSNILPKNTYKKCLSLFNKTPVKEDEVISKMNQALNVLSNPDLDIYSKGAIFLLNFLKTMPYYGVLDNVFMACFALASYFYNEGKTLLAVSIWQIFFSEESLSFLVNYAYETFSKDNHGDLMHFVYPFVSLLKDGVLKISQSLKLSQTKKDNLRKSLGDDFSKSEKEIIDVLLSSSIYSSFGIGVKRIEEVSKISLPTINRLLKKLKDKGRLDKIRIGKNDFYKVI